MDYAYIEWNLGEVHGHGFTKKGNGFLSLGLCREGLFCHLALCKHARNLWVQSRSITVLGRLFVMKCGCNWRKVCM